MLNSAWLTSIGLLLLGLLVFYGFTHPPKESDQPRIPLRIQYLAIGVALGALLVMQDWFVLFCFIVGAALIEMGEQQKHNKAWFNIRWDEMNKQQKVIGSCLFVVAWIGVASVPHW